MDTIGKTINLNDLDKEYEEDDDVDIEDLPWYDERKPKEGQLRFITLILSIFITVYTLPTA